MANVKLVQGNEACVLGALAAGATFLRGVPHYPSTEIAEHMAAKLPPLGGKVLLKWKMRLPLWGRSLGLLVWAIKPLPPLLARVFL